MSNLALFWIFVALQIADAVTTYIIVEKRSGLERNPIMRFFMEGFGVVAGLLAMKSVVVLLMYIYIVPLSYGHIILGGAVLVYVVVVGHNVIQIRKR